jgi:hypothetical protein
VAASSPDTHAVFPAVLHAFVVVEEIVEAIVFVSNNDERNRCANYSRYQDHRSCFHRPLFLA